MTKEFIIIQPNPLFDPVNRPGMQVYHEVIYKADEIEVDSDGHLILKRDENGTTITSCIFKPDYWVAVLERFCIKQAPTPSPQTGV